jgi:hypothetical protein
VPEAEAVADATVPEAEAVADALPLEVGVSSALANGEEEDVADALPLEVPVSSALALGKEEDVADALLADEAVGAAEAVAEEEAVADALGVQPAPAKMPTTSTVEPSSPGFWEEQAGLIFRMRWLYESATYTVPLESTATPSGESKEALVPKPSANAADPLPAKVVTTPPGVTLRTLWLPWSAT